MRTPTAARRRDRRPVGERHREVLGPRLPRCLRGPVQAGRRTHLLGFQRLRRGLFCDDDTEGLVNAAYCEDNNTIGWDRGVLLPSLRAANGDMAITMVLAHEYGHCDPEDGQAEQEGHADAGGRAAGRLLRRGLHALGGRGQLPPVHAEHRRRAQQPPGRHDLLPRPTAEPGRRLRLATTSTVRPSSGSPHSSSGSPTGRRRARASTPGDRPAPRRPADRVAARTRPESCR